ncbi:MAG: NUDIX hydrolase [Patescibacteria group bacterium]
MDHRAMFDAMKFLGQLREENYEEYKNTVAQLLAGVDSYKPLGTQLYLAVCQHGWGNYFESVALRAGANGVIEVFMTKRDEKDPDWQGYWHVPGTALRYSDTEEIAKARLAREYGVPILSLIRAGDAGFGWFKKGDEGRGPGMSFVFNTELEGEPMLNERRGWFDVEHLPKPTVPSHINPIIPIAVKAFRHLHL